MEWMWVRVEEELEEELSGSRRASVILAAGRAEWEHPLLPKPSGVWRTSWDGEWQQVTKRTHSCGEAPGATGRGGHDVTPHTAGPWGQDHPVFLHHCVPNWSDPKVLHKGGLSPRSCR